MYGKNIPKIIANQNLNCSL